MGKEHILHAGDVVCALRGTTLKTLLGSCVSIVLATMDRRVGAMSHVLVGGAPRDCGPRACAYGEAALQRMYGLLEEQGARADELEAFVFGGGRMWQAQGPAARIGSQNASWALASLARDGIPVRAACLGGEVYRKVAWLIGPDAPVVRQGSMR